MVKVKLSGFWAGCGLWCCLLPVTRCETKNSQLQVQEPLESPTQVSTTFSTPVKKPIQKELQIRRAIHQAILLINARQYDLALDKLDKLLFSLQKRGPSNRRLEFEVQLAIEECLKQKFDNANLASKVPNTKKRLKILSHIINKSPLAFLVEHRVYVRLIHAILSLSEPAFGAAGPKKALKLIAVYRKLLTDAGKTSVHAEELKELELRALAARDSALFEEAVILCNKKGLSVAAMKVLAEADNPESPLYTQARAACDALEKVYAGECAC